MTMSNFKSIRIGHAGGKHQRKRDGCSSGGLYKSPSKGATIDTTQPVEVAWDTTCLDTDTIDLYLYAPSAESSFVQGWSKIDYSQGNYNVTLNAGWWNYTSPMTLEFTIAPSDEEVFMISTPAGPLFNATYTASAAATTTSSSSAVAGAIQQVNNSAKEEHGLSKGRIAAAVLVPLLVIIGLVSAAYIRITRQKGKEKRKRFSQMVDKRMSTISTDWKSLSGAGANAAIRNSIAVSGGNRASSFSFGAIRPSSTVAEDGGHAGIGARGADGEQPPMSQLRPGVRTSAFENRVSRVSFAADTRPSMESRRTRAFHEGHVPPVPVRQLSNDSPAAMSPIMSPVQTAGPLSLTVEDIRARMSGQEAEPRPSMDDVMPALSLMRTGDATGNELLFDTQMPASPPPTHQAHQTQASPMSPVMGVMPMQPMPANVMSPDDMLRAYAERRAMGGGAMAGAPAMPSPVANYNGNGMRVLYSPDNGAIATPASPESMYPASTVNRKSLAPTEHSKYDEEDAYAYVGTAE